MATNFNIKIAKINLFPFIHRPDIRKRIAISPLSSGHRIGMCGYTAVPKDGRTCFILFYTSDGLRVNISDNTAQ